jgi:hypothetical protein
MYQTLYGICAGSYIMYLLEVSQRKKTINKLKMTHRKRAEVVLFVGKIN